MPLASRRSGATLADIHACLQTRFAREDKVKEYNLGKEREYLREHSSVGQPLSRLRQHMTDGIT
jgi:hypothetical protein